MKFLILFISVLFFTGCIYKDVAIHGNAKGISDAVVEIAGNDGVWADNIVNGKFAISPKIKKADFYSLKVIFNGRSQNTIYKTIYLEKGNYNITFDPSNSKAYPKIESKSETQKDLSVFYSMPGAGSTESTETFILKHPHSLVSAYILKETWNEQLAANPKLYLRLYNSLDEEIQSSRYAKKAKFLISSFNMADKEMPDLKGITTEGKIFNKGLLKGKLTLIAFWASWNSPSLRDIPKLKELYKQLHSKGFEIVGISIDKTEKRWKRAIADNKLNWLHVADFKGAYSENFAAFYTNKLPCYIIIGPDLKIVDHTIPIESVNIYFNDFLKQYPIK